MIAIDTCSFIAYLQGDLGQDVDAIRNAFIQSQAILPPMVLSELLSDPRLNLEVSNTIKQIPLLEITAGFWERVGLLRSKLLAKKLKSRVVDACIAQICIDHDTPLITRDIDFRHYENKFGLIILIEACQ